MHEEFSARGVLGAKGFCCYEGVVTRDDYEEWSQEVYVAVTKGFLLALYKEGQSDPDPPRGPRLFATQIPPRASGPLRATGDWTNDRCQVTHRGAHLPSGDQLQAEL